MTISNDVKRAIHAKMLGWLIIIKLWGQNKDASHSCNYLFSAGTKHPPPLNVNPHMGYPQGNQDASFLSIPCGRQFGDDLDEKLQYQTKWACEPYRQNKTYVRVDALRIWSQQNKHLNYIQIRNFQTRLRLSIATACRFGTSNCLEENSMIWFFSGMPSCLELVFLPRSLLLGRARYLWNWVGPCDTPSEPSLVWKFLRLDDFSFITFCFVVRLLCIA